MTGLPQGWVKAPLMDIIELHDARRIPLNATERASRKGPYPYYGANGQVDSVDDYLFDGEFVLLAEDGGFFDNPARGVAYEAKGQFWVNNHAHILSGRGDIETSFLKSWLNSVDWMQYVSGSTRLKLTQAGMSGVEIPLPPLPEQQRIVRKLDTLSARTTTARTHLTAIEKLVERYKSGVLSLELSGVLLGHEVDETNIQPSTNDKERGGWSFDAVPAHWAWTTFKAFLENRTDSHRKLPQKDYQSEGPYPVIDQGADLIGGYCADAKLLLPAEPPYIIFGDHTRCVKFFEAPFVQGADGVKVFHAGKDVDIRFAYWALKGLQLPDKGYSRHAKFLKESFFPLPPLDEQREIVSRIETAFAKIDRLATEAAKALKLLGHLDQRILAKAFAGELVPQDPTDEPAEALLARIREARAATPKPKRGRKART